MLYLTATFFAVFAALPFAWMVFTIFKTNQDMYNGQNNPFLFKDARRRSTMFGCSGIRPTTRRFLRTPCSCRSVW